MNELMTSEELTKILEQHRLYLHGDPDGVRANLSKANLVGEDLTSQSDTKKTAKRLKVLGLTNLRYCRNTFVSIL